LKDDAPAGICSGPFGRLNPGHGLERPESLSGLDDRGQFRVLGSDISTFLNYLLFSFLVTRVQTPTGAILNLFLD